MTGIVLSASVRQNLLSLQSTASLLATTQNDLATGLKVNSALDNPTNFFTAQGLDNRASDIANLLDGIGKPGDIRVAQGLGGHDPPPDEVRVCPGWSIPRMARPISGFLILETNA